MPKCICSYTWFKYPCLFIIMRKLRNMKYTPAKSEVPARNLARFVMDGVYSTVVCVSKRDFSVFAASLNTRRVWIPMPPRDHRSNCIELVVGMGGDIITFRQDDVLELESYSGLHQLVRDALGIATVSLVSCVLRFSSIYLIAFLYVRFGC